MKRIVFTIAFAGLLSGISTLTGCGSGGGTEAVEPAEFAPPPGEETAAEGGGQTAVQTESD